MQMNEGAVAKVSEATCSYVCVISHYSIYVGMGPNQREIQELFINTEQGMYQRNSVLRIFSTLQSCARMVKSKVWHVFLQVFPQQAASIHTICR